MNNQPGGGRGNAPQPQSSQQPALVPIYNQQGQIVGYQQNAARDINNNSYVNVEGINDLETQLEEYRGGGAGAKLFMGLGCLLSAGGFLGFMGGILLVGYTMFTSGGAAFAADSYDSMRTATSGIISSVGTSLIPVACSFGAMIIGILIFTAGRTMGRSRLMQRSQQNPGYRRY
jgi:hypothetical protein